LIATEIANANKGKKAGIQAKMNSLIEPEIIQALYRASQAGVKVDLLVRGVCSLRPKLEGISDNIRVRSIIGRFLEHTRVFCFDNDGDRKVFLSSADWMGRNFFSRVETCFPVLDQALRARVFDESIKNYMDDNCQAWEMNSDGTYERRVAKQHRRSGQESLLSKLS
jgi:polyphosphate kinase